MSQELLNTSWKKTSGTNFTTSSEGLILDGTGVWIYGDYIPLPVGTGITYEYEIICSIDANNQVYFQIERFNANKGSISNNAAVNCIGGVKPTTAVDHGIYRGTLNLATFGDNQQTAYIRPRACTGYNSTTGVFKIHTYSLRAINGTSQTASIKKNGECLSSHLRETGMKQGSFSQNGFINAENFYEY